NKALYLNVTVPVMRCPASNQPLFSDYDARNGFPPAGNDGYFRPTYTCVMGSDAHSSTDTTAPYGPVSGGAVLILGGGIKTSRITDGTSNTILVGETSDYGVDAAGANQEITVDNDRGFHMGTSYVNVAPNGPGSMTASAPTGVCTSNNGNC